MINLQDIHRSLIGLLLMILGCLAISTLNAQNSFKYNKIRDTLESSIAMNMENAQPTFYIFATFSKFRRFLVTKIPLLAMTIVAMRKSWEPCLKPILSYLLPSPGYVFLMNTLLMHPNYALFQYEITFDRSLDRQHTCQQFPTKDCFWVLLPIVRLRFLLWLNAL